MASGIRTRPWAEGCTQHSKLDHWFIPVQALGTCATPATGNHALPFPTIGRFKGVTCGKILQKGRGKRFERKLLKGNTCENENSGKVGGRRKE